MGDWKLRSRKRIEIRKEVFEVLHGIKTDIIKWEDQRVFGLLMFLQMVEGITNQNAVFLEQLHLYFDLLFIFEL